MKFLSAIALPVLMAIVLFLRTLAWPQLPPPNPLTAPRPLPSPPAQLPAPVQPQGIPSLAIVAPVVTTAPTPIARVFNCSCFGPSTPTHWMGVVTAPGYFAARQTAVNACLSYNENKEPQPPILPSGPASSTEAAAAGIVSNQAALVSSRAAGQQLPGTVTSFTVQQLLACSRCTCD